VSSSILASGCLSAAVAELAVQREDAGEFVAGPAVGALLESDAGQLVASGGLAVAVAELAAQL
jgi:hypothetical protein